MASASKPPSSAARPLEALSAWIPGMTPTLAGAMLCSIFAHALVLSIPGLIVLPHSPKVERSLEVVLVNSKSPEKPTDAKLLAQSNLDGGGNTDEENRRAQTPLPPIDARAASLRVQQARYEDRVAQLERQARRLLTQIHSDKSVASDRAGSGTSQEVNPKLVPDHVLSEQPPRPQTASPRDKRPDAPAEADRLHSPSPGTKPSQTKLAQAETEREDAAARAEKSESVPPSQTQSAQPVPVPESSPPPSSTELAARAMNIARLEAVIAKNFDAYQSRPKRKFIGARTAEYRFARYVEEWRAKVERIGNLNYPEAAKQRDLHGSLQLTVAIKADGQIESVEINKSSGHKILDAAALHIVELAAPFAVFSPDMRADTDILHITRTWTFTRADQLTSE